LFFVGWPEFSGWLFFFGGRLKVGGFAMVSDDLTN